MYSGEIGKNAYSRGQEHQDSFRQSEVDHPMVKHSVEDHGGTQDVAYQMKVTGTFGKDNMKRRVDEALRITRNPGKNLNSKSEFHQPSLPRIVVMNNRNVSV
jgi:hypothetical protein